MDYYSRIVKSVYGDIDKAKRNKIVLHILYYLFRIESVPQLNKAVRFILKDSLENNMDVLSLRKKLVKKSYAFNIKAYLFAIVATEVVGKKKEIDKLADKYQIKESDRNLVRFLKDDRLKEKLQEYSFKYRVFSLEEFNAEVAELLETVDVWTKKYVIRKMRFIMRSQRLDYTDLVSDLMIRGIRGLIYMYPLYKTKLHMLNQLKRVIHNYGQNIIKYYTRNVRDATSGKKVSYDALIEGVFLRGQGITQTVSNIKGDNQLSSSMRDCDDGLSLEISLKQLMKKIKSKRKRKLLQLLMGRKDEEFTHWLSDKRVCSETFDNTDLYERCLEKDKIERYKTYVFKFLDISPNKGELFLKKVAKQLS